MTNPFWADPILTCTEARALEARLFGGNEEREWAAMECAGAGVAASIQEDFEEIGGFSAAGRVLVLAGKGHNGGDALLAAAAILEKHPAASADVIFVFGERSLRPLAARAWRRLLEAARQRVRVLSAVPGAGDGVKYGNQESRKGIAGQSSPLTAVSRSAWAQTSLPESHMVPPPLAARASGEPNPVAASVSEWGDYDLCLDGIFGFQFRPPVDAATVALLGAVNAHPAIRLRAAVDLPSGVGEPSGDTAFRADFTYATGSVKAPLLEERNRNVAGRLRYVDLGFFEQLVAGVADPGPGSAHSTSSGQATPATPLSVAGDGFVLKRSLLAPLAGLRAPLSDKRTYGHLFVIGGSRDYPGAVLMCARAALRSGAGLVTAFVPETLVATFAASVPEAIWVGWPETPDGGLAMDGLHLLRARLERATALVMGCGLGREAETLALAAEIVKLAGVPVVLDADALQPSVLAAARGRQAICLPHAGEFKRLARGREASAAALRAVAQEASAIIALKGPVTQISDGERVFHSFFGGPVLARGGSGDLLAGLTGGLLAQAPSDPLTAACRGVVWHGRAADLLARDRGQVAVQATQLLDYLPAALREAVC
jgi:ADP-dependent NAD(P)H-hydrate dehydratase / NAD(P)H-hydrate epimerase